MLQTPLSRAWCCPLIGQYSVTKLLIGYSQGMLQSSMSQSTDGLVRYYLWSKASTIATGKWDAHTRSKVRVPQILFSLDQERVSAIHLRVSNYFMMGREESRELLNGRSDDARWLAVLRRAAFTAYYTAIVWGFCKKCVPLPIFGPPCPMINDWGLRNNNYRWPGELCLLGFRPWGAYFCHYRFPDLIIWIIRNGFITQHNVKVATSLGEVKGWITSVNPIPSWLGDKRSGKQKS